MLASEYAVDVAFLARHLSAEDLRFASRKALDGNETAHEYLIRRGRIGRSAYVQCLAVHLDLPFHDLSDARIAPSDLADAINGTAARNGCLRAELPGLGSSIVLAPRGRAIIRLIEDRLRNGLPATRMVLTTPALLWNLCLGADKGAATAHALTLLETRHANTSVRTIRPGSRMALAALVLLVPVLALLQPVPATSLLALVASLLFLVAAAVRIDALVHSTLGPLPLRAKTACSMPLVTVLVPLASEAAVVPQLLRGLDALDYPAGKLDVILLVEADDASTIASLRTHDPGERYLVLCLPPGGPRTKPRALQFGLVAARGSLIVVYDAEDEPDPLQLRAAAHRFAEAPSALACLQARLTIHNSGAGFLPRQFAIEYAALFRVLVPGLARNQMPIPLGGTSNIFKTSALKSVGGWDPWNVTEDADLGLRLARAGYTVEALASDTDEEAPTSLVAWLNQRTRWMKGWIGTIIVVSRRAAPELPALGPSQRLAVAGTIGATLISALIYPLLPLALALAAMSELATGTTWLDALIFGIGAAAFVGGHGYAMAMSWRGARLAGLNPGLRDMAGLPVYWFLSSIAAWRALFAFVVNPQAWSKTHHVGRRGLHPQQATRILPQASLAPGE
jgi:cellulose synthase/poly-beta-1,6-N-acetylglucosamine synthase-like glycosyltransferase